MERNNNPSPNIQSQFTNIIAIDVFVNSCMECKNNAKDTLFLLAMHEAGHRFMWKQCFPKIKTVYAISRCKYPGVVREDGEHVLEIKKLSREDAGKYICIKLAGYAAEMLALGIDGNYNAIVDFIVEDYFGVEKTKRTFTTDSYERIDWRDDAEHGGDIPTAIMIMQGKKSNIKESMKACLNIILDTLTANGYEFEKEFSEAFLTFTKWQEAGLVEL